MKRTDLQTLYWVVEHGDFKHFGFGPEEPVMIEKESHVAERQAVCDAIAEWLLKQGQALGASFEYQGGAEIQAQYRAKAEALYRLFER